MSGENEREGVSLPDNFSAMLDKVLANPELISTVAKVLSADAVKKGEDTGEKESVSASAGVLGDKLPELVNMLGPMLNTKKGSARESDRRTSLLCAMKPYVNEHRCEAIDYMIKFSRLADLIKGMN